MADAPPLPKKRYSIIYADPPWMYRDKHPGGNRGAEDHYPTMTLEAICALPVPTIAAENCMLFLWITMPKLDEVFQVIAAWGFVYKTCAFTWVKRNKKALAWFFGMGHWTRGNAELCLLATRGKPKRISTSVPSIVDTPIERHSRKPAVVRQRIVKLCGSLPRIELFSRQRISGWDSWGLDMERVRPRHPAYDTEETETGEAVEFIRVPWRSTRLAPGFAEKLGLDKEDER